MQDYLLVGTDINAKMAIRFLSLNHNLKQLFECHKPHAAIQKNYARFVLASVLLGSRFSEQEATLYKVRYSNQTLGYNCEVSPKGPFRSAVIGNYEEGAKLVEGKFQVVRLKKNKETYESVIQPQAPDIIDVYRSFLVQSEQSVSQILFHEDVVGFDKNFGLWVEKLPGTSNSEWRELTESFQERVFFDKSFSATTDPDKIIESLFPEKMRILAVTKPSLFCSCSKERIIEALKILPESDLAEIFVAGEGVATRCEYCGKDWLVTDAEIKELMKKESKTVH